LTATDTAAYRQVLHDVKRSPRGRVYQHHARITAGDREKPGVSHCGAEQPAPGEVKLPLLVGADFERGTAMRLDEGTSFPTAMALAAGGSPKDAYAMGKITALEARAVGIH